MSYDSAKPIKEAKMRQIVSPTYAAYGASDMEEQQYVPSQLSLLLTSNLEIDTTHHLRQRRRSHHQALDKTPSSTFSKDFHQHSFKGVKHSQSLSMLSQTYLALSLASAGVFAGVIPKSLPKNSESFLDFPRGHELISC